MSERKDHDPLFGRTLAVLVLKALETLPAPTTNMAIADHLIAAHEPAMRYRGRQRLLERIGRITKDYHRGGLLDHELQTSTRKVTYNAYTLKPPTNARP